MNDTKQHGIPPAEGGCHSPERSSGRIHPEQSPGSCKPDKVQLGINKIKSTASIQNYKNFINSGKEYTHLLFLDVQPSHDYTSRTLPEVCKKYIRDIQNEIYVDIHDEPIKFTIENQENRRKDWGKKINC